MIELKIAKNIIKNLEFDKLKVMNKLFEEMRLVFQTAFNNVLDKFQDKRKFILEESSNENFCFSLEYYDLKEIQIHYNRKRIIREYLENTNRIKVELVETFKYLAQHEYYHNLICDTSQDLDFEIYLKEEISNIERFNYIRMENKFREYFADYKVIHFFNDIPKNYIESVIYMLKHDVDLNYHCYGMLPVKNDNSSTKDQLKIYSYLQNLYRFHICNCWDLLELIFDRNNRTNLLIFFRLLFQSFQEIIESYESLNKIRDSVFKLIKFLDQCQFEDLIFRDTLSNKIKNSLMNLEFESIV